MKNEVIINKRYNTPGWALGVYFSGSYCYVAVFTGGFDIYEFYELGIDESGKGEISPFRVLINPVRDKIVLLNLGNQDDELSLYDKLGQRVKVFNVKAGENIIPVNDLPGGAYFIKGNKATGLKVLITR